MLNQTTKQNGTQIDVVITDTVDSGVTVTLKDKNKFDKFVGMTATASGTTYSYTITGSTLDSLGTYTAEWSYTSSGVSKKKITKLDVLEDTQVRYCYQSDVTRKLYGMLIPDGLDIGAYSLRASNEINRALQGIYTIPLALDSEHDNYDIDYTSLIELCADIAAGYLIEDINISRVNSSNSFSSLFNMKKQAAFAELNRYADLKKVFASAAQDTVRDTARYQSEKPSISSPNFVANSETSNDPFDTIYNNFSPVSQ